MVEPFGEGILYEVEDSADPTTPPIYIEAVPENYGMAVYIYGKKPDAPGMSNADATVFVDYCDDTIQVLTWDERTDPSDEARTSETLVASVALSRKRMPDGEEAAG